MRKPTPVRADGEEPTKAQQDMMIALAEGKYRVQKPINGSPTNDWFQSDVCMARKSHGMWDVMRVNENGKAEWIGRLEKLPE
jgi:hypothetical protein